MTYVPIHGRNQPYMNTCFYFCLHLYVTYSIYWFNSLFIRFGHSFYTDTQPPYVFTLVMCWPLTLYNINMIYILLKREARTKCILKLSTFLLPDYPYCNSQMNLSMYNKNGYNNANYTDKYAIYIYVYVYIYTHTLVYIICMYLT